MTPLIALIALSSTFAKETKTYSIDGLERTALVFSTKSKNPPLVFCFHGHGGTANHAARSFRIHEVWPEAVVVYMQGLPTATPNDPKGLKPGWQTRKGIMEDRDLKFFDAVYKDLVKTYQLDKSRVYSMGHSNGGRFTYLLMQQRGELFAAFGPSGSPSFIADMPTKPVFHVAGEKDPIVSFQQQSRTLDLIKRRNGCEEGKSVGKYTTKFEGKNDDDVVAYFHPGGHEFPKPIPELLVEFFKKHKK